MAATRELAEFDLASSGKARQRPLDEDWVEATRRMVEEGRAARSARWRTQERESHA